MSSNPHLDVVLLSLFYSSDLFTLFLNSFSSYGTLLQLVIMPIQAEEMAGRLESIERIVSNIFVLPIRLTNDDENSNTSSGSSRGRSCSRLGPAQLALEGRK
eukprot:GHVT01037327.1.p3 GENE.GHVT01037327.1~~GHVT01037327.1.p3  ORF type:complete len:102 (-),score=7.32 GHVT01037327.1:823-1128(-)